MAGEIAGKLARAVMGHGEPTASIETHAKTKDDAPPMKAVVWKGKKHVDTIERPRPALTDPEDIVLRVTSSCICGSDLHLYEGYMLGMKSGDVLGHEFMGVVEEVGPGVMKLSPGQRVVVCFDIGCGSCAYCKQGLFSCCDRTNPSAVLEGMYGHRTGGLFGYSHLLGGYEGGQAEYVRVPYADVNCLPVPSDLPDERVILLSDILPTAWHACKLGEVGPGKNVAIWGAGPVGMLAAQCAQNLGAASVTLIDREAYRLEFATQKLKTIKTINYGTTNVSEALRAMYPEMGGPDVCIEAVGFHYAKTLAHTVMQKLNLETDPADVLNELIKCCRKGGIVSVIGAYAGYTNAFNIGAFMEKSLTMRGGQTPCQRYWPELMPKVSSGELDPSWVITHILPLEQASQGYKIFDSKSDNCIKVMLKPAHSRQEPAGVTTAAV